MGGEVKAKMESFVRISALLWADILVAYALFVMQSYLTDVWKLSFTHAAGILNIWDGISKILPVLFLFFVDTILGHFKMVVLSSIAYSVGIGLVAMSTPPVLANATGTCKQYKPQCVGHTQKVLFYTGMALVAVGMAGHLVSIKTFLEEQEKENAPAIDCCKLPAFALVAIFPIIGAIALPYVKPWALRFGIPAICTAFTTLLFFTGWCKYNKVDPKGSPITHVCRVFVAFAFKISQSRPDNKQFYRKNEQESFTDSRLLRCLEKAAIKLPDISTEEQVKKRRLCSVGEVEEAKIAVRMVPMWLTFIVCGIVSSFGNTYFLEQAKPMSRKIGSWKVPLPAFLLLFEGVKKLYRKWAAKCLKKDEKYGPPIGIAVSMIFSILCCVTAALVEITRLKAIRNHGLLDKPDEDIPMSAGWLLIQFTLLAGLDAIFEKSVAEFYKCQAPESMRNYLGYFAKVVFGLGFICGVLSVHVVGKISEKGGRRNWFQYTLNRSRLDRYYWVLAGLSCVNLLVFVVVACSYTYRDPVPDAQDTPGEEAEVSAFKAGDPADAEFGATFI